jgi:hypothetical protein
MKKHFTILIVLIASCTISSGQSLPNYIPTNGLIGWWPFNGNAIDESGNGNNGTINVATLTENRFGVANSAYDFSNEGSSIQTILDANESPASSSDYTISFWAQRDNPDIFNSLLLTYKNGGVNGPNTSNYDIVHAHNFCPNSNGIAVQNFPFNNPSSCSPDEIQYNQWYHIVVHFKTSQQSFDLYNNGEYWFSGNLGSIVPSAGVLTFGNNDAGNFPTQGQLDDIGIWNRALTQQEITELYNAVNCASNIVITPQTNSLTTGSSATFTATTSDLNPSHIWQSDFGQGFQTLLEFGNYSGTNTSSLSIANVQLSEHNQPIRVITTSGECVDTSDIATISILDTCVTSINDTTFVTVTDTLVINTLITGINPPNNSNTIKVYPNPANTHITIEYGDFAIMNGYQLRIENSLGQEVFQTSITQESDYLNLNSWGGNGLYFVHIADPQGNTIDIRKIVLQ